MHQHPTGKALPPAGITNPIATTAPAGATTATAGGGGGGSRTMAAVSDDGSTGSCLDRVSRAVHSGMEAAFAGIARAVVARPVTTIAVVVLLTAALAQGIHRYEEDTNNLFAPRSSRAVEEETYVEDTFGKQPIAMTAYFAADTTGNMLTADGIRLLSEYHASIVHNVTGTHKGEPVTYVNVCETGTTESTAVGAPAAPPTLSACRKALSPLTLWDNAPPAALGDLTDAAVLEAVNSEQRWRAFAPSGANVTFYLSPEGLVRDEATGEIVAAKAVRVQMWLTAGVGNDGDERSQSFERGVLDYVLDDLQPAARAKGYSVEVQTSAEERDASNSSMNNDFSVLASGYLLMIAYACFVLARARPMYSHISVALASVGSVGMMPALFSFYLSRFFISLSLTGMSTLSAYGFCWLIGLKFNPVVQVLVLVLLGIGIDDTFVIMDSWWDNAHITNMGDRMIKAVSRAGPAVALTSATDLIAFLAGSSTDIPAIEMFCYYAATGIFLDFAYQITFVVAVLYLDSTRQEAGRRDCCCCCTVRPEQGWVGQCCVNGTRTFSDPSDEPAGTAAPYDEAERGALHHAVGYLLPKHIVGTVVGRCAVVAISVAFLGAGIYGCTQVTMNFNNEWFIPSGHRYRDVMEMRDAYFGGRSLSSWAVSKDLKYSSADAQVLVEDVAQALEGSRWVVDGSVGSWLRSFARHVNATSPASLDTTSRSGYTIVKEADFYPLLNTFRRTPAGASVNYNLAWNEARTEIVASWLSFTIVTGPLTDGSLAVDCLNDLRETLDAYSAFPYHFVFVHWEGYRTLIAETARNVGAAGGAVFVLVTLLTANLWIGLTVMGSIACVDTCMMGYMPLLGVELNSVSLICVVMAVGLAVDYSVHIAGAFLDVSATDCDGFSARQQRAAYAMWKMGAAVVNGGFSTFLAVLPLVMAQSYPFKVFFRMLSLIIFFGLWFGVLVVPVFLSVCGPGPNPAAKPLENEPWTNPLDARFKTAKAGKTVAGEDIEMV